jgi:tRNA (guanosine-2'-O-)-methyltransferase
MLMEMADEFMTIDMYGFTESFNVSVSAGIILHYLRNVLVNKRINWHLSESEKQIIKLDWIKKSLKRSELIEKEFYIKKSMEES